jgi:hypothetical protein
VIDGANVSVEIQLRDIRTEWNQTEVLPGVAPRRLKRIRHYLSEYRRRQREDRYKSSHCDCQYNYSG